MKVELDIYSNEIKKRILDKIAEYLLGQIQYQLFLTNITNKTEIARSFSVDIDPSSGTIAIRTSMDPIPTFLNSGTKPRTMTHLIGRSIPIKTKDGRTIIRKVTWDQILSGGWRHPGMQGQRFLERAIENTKSMIPRIIREEIGNANSQSAFGRNFSGQET